MRFWMGITDHDWFRFLAARPELPEVNFWQPSAGRRPVALVPGHLFLFKLHASHGGAIVGGGFFAHYSALPVRMTWDTFGIENGAASFEEMVARIGKYRSGAIDIHADQAYHALASRSGMQCPICAKIGLCPEEAVDMTDHQLIVASVHAADRTAPATSRTEAWAVMRDVDG